ncbi:hypothetical protein H6794_03395 [Candidatus Nomurabacteria bacterium]|nr:hypothetical protein [Candidatus Nomurabacteria bacterium]
MATDKSPKTTKKSTKKSSKKTKVDSMQTETSNKGSSTNVATELDFGDKLTWIFNNWRAVWEAFILNIGHTFWLLSYLLS